MLTVSKCLFFLNFILIVSLHVITITIHTFFRINFALSCKRSRSWSGVGVGPLYQRHSCCLDEQPFGSYRRWHLCIKPHSRKTKSTTFLGFGPPAITMTSRRQSSSALKREKFRPCCKTHESTTIYGDATITFPYY